LRSGHKRLGRVCAATLNTGAQVRGPWGATEREADIAQQGPCASAQGCPECPPGSGAVEVRWPATSGKWLARHVLTVIQPRGLLAPQTTTPDVDSKILDWKWDTAMNDGSRNQKNKTSSAGTSSDSAVLNAGKRGPARLLCARPSVERQPQLLRPRPQERSPHHPSRVHLQVSNRRSGVRHVALELRPRRVARARVAEAGQHPGDVCTHTGLRVCAFRAAAGAVLNAPSQKKTTAGPPYPRTSAQRLPPATGVGHRPTGGVGWPSTAVG